MLIISQNKEKVMRLSKKQNDIIGQDRYRKCY
nr:MAG TPA: hypothetical protein [Caudoviricetes sp.]